MMDLQAWKQRHEEMMGEAQRERLAKELRGSRKRRGPGRTSSLLWDLRRHAGRLRKLYYKMMRTEIERTKRRTR
jgi:hypothetical protein